MDDADPTYRKIIDSLRDGGHYSDKPPLPPNTDGARREPVQADWEPRVDRQLEQLHGDVRNLLRAGAAAAVGIAALIAGLYVRTDGKFEAVNEKIARIEVQQQRIEGKLDLLIERKKDANR